MQTPFEPLNIDNSSEVKTNNDAVTHSTLIGAVQAHPQVNGMNYEHRDKIKIIQNIASEIFNNSATKKAERAFLNNLDEESKRT